MQIALAVGKKQSAPPVRRSPYSFPGLKKETPCNIQFRYSILLAKNTTHTEQARPDSSVNRSQVERTEGEMKLPACRHLAASFSHHISLLTRFPPPAIVWLIGPMAPHWLLASIHSNTNVLNVLITRNDFLRQQSSREHWQGWLQSSEYSEFETWS